MLVRIEIINVLSLTVWLAILTVFQLFSSNPLFPCDPFETALHNNVTVNLPHDSLPFLKIKDVSPSGCSDRRRDENGPKLSLPSTSMQPAPHHRTGQALNLPSL